MYNGDQRGKEELVSQIAVMESPRIAKESGQARFLSKILRDPTAVGDLLEAEEPGVETAVTMLVRRVEGLVEESFGGPCQKIAVSQVDLA